VGIPCFDGEIIAACVECVLVIMREWADEGVMRLEWDEFLVKLIDKFAIGGAVVWFSFEVEHGGEGDVGDGYFFFAGLDGGLCKLWDG
jgi:hypothetical protein